MENINPELEQRVWQRVGGMNPGNASPEEMMEMMAAAVESAAVYRQLASGDSGRRREQLQRLADGELRALHALRGMVIQTGGTPAPTTAYGLGRNNRRRALAQCLRRGQENYRRFASRVAEACFGAVFQHLASEQARRLCETLELIGE